jgi:hypothetical protein
MLKSLSRKNLSVQKLIYEYYSHWMEVGWTKMPSDVDCTRNAHHYIKKKSRGEALSFQDCHRSDLISQDDQLEKQPSWSWMYP